MDAITASVITGLGAAVVAGCSTLAGVVLTLRSSGQQQARALRAQEHRDEAVQDEARRYRDHERRINAAAQFIEAFDAFRREVNDLDPDSSESRNKAAAAARALADACALVDLYFSENVQECSGAASGIIVDMHLRKLEGRDLSDRNNAATTARQELINEMKLQLGEAMHHDISTAASSDPQESSARR